MPDTRRTNRSMFWRIVRHLLLANRGRLVVILLALGAGAAVTAALLNLQVDAKRRLTTEFRAFGPNVIIAPRTSGVVEPATIGQTLLQEIPSAGNGQVAAVVAYLYFLGGFAQSEIPKDFVPVVVAGSSANTCRVGARLAARMKLQPPRQIWIVNQAQSAKESCRMDAIESTGGPEDDRVSIPLEMAQRLTGLAGRVSLIQVAVPGAPREIDAYIANLRRRFPGADVHGVRQFTEAEGKIYNRISGLLNATVALVLLLTSLCVMASMTNVAMERKNDVGLMKAIGGATRRVLRLFLAEAAVLGFTGGVLGAAAGIAISIWLGKAVFGLAARPRLIVYPVAVALTIVVAIAGAFPLRRLAGVRPASVFRGEA